MSVQTTLRERKRQRTREAIIDAAIELFASHGYDRTTVADIAAAADIGTRTFFSYFASKDEVLFPEADARVVAAIEAIESRDPDERPADVLLRALSDVVDAGHDVTGRLAQLRVHLIQTVPAVRGRALQLQLDAQREIARHLHAAYPDDLDEVTAGAVVGAFVGAVAGAIQAMVDAGMPDDPQALRRAADVALKPWRR